MSEHLSRRSALKFVAAGFAATGVACTSSTLKDRNFVELKNHSPMKDKWKNTHDRTWLGGEYWANPMEDWHIVDGGAECTSLDGNRSIHSLTHRLTNSDAPFSMEVTLRQIENKSELGGAGFRLGVNNEINEYRSSCFVQKGLDAGIINNQLSIAGKTAPLSEKIADRDIVLSLVATPQIGATSISLKATIANSGKVIGQLSHLVPGSDVIGNVALVSNFAISSHPKDEKTGNLYRFSNWSIEGEAFDVKPERKFGPILWSMYSLSDSRKDDGFVMKMSVYTGPMGLKDSSVVELQVQQKGTWVSVGESKLDPDAWVANFRIPRWNEKLAAKYRLIYCEKHIDGSETPDIYDGIIRANPVGRPLRMAAMTCQNDYSFPYAPVAENIKKLDPDIAFFSGDQIYESHGGFGVIREPFTRSLHNYLRKFYQFGWAFREVMRDQPTICLPDDHDVLQGNLWGEGGAPKKNPEQDPTGSLTGGYFQTIKFVNLVHLTTVSHNPDPYDPTPNPTGLSNYYCDMVYGNVGFAILADRQWKTGPEQAGVVVGETGVGEDITSINPAINPADSQLLGQRQEDFLEQWADDWRGHTLKAILSQTVMAGLATHQPTPERYLKYDFDSNGWPTPARNRAVSIMRKSKALHICGDTHLPSLGQYGVENQRDSNWSFCTPAISAGWPRFWLPDQMGIPHQNRPSHGLPQTGEFIDAFGGKVYIYSIGIPEIGKSSNRYVKAHEKGSGFGFITFDTEKQTFTLDAYRYLIDVLDDKDINQFDGWPVTIHQDENIGKNRLG